jgi:DNA-binding response OmpR family regulator
MRVLIIEDVLATASALKKLLELKVHMVEVSLASTMVMGLEAREPFRPDICLIDAELPDSKAFETPRRIPEFAPAAVLIMSAHDEDLLVSATFENGGTDFLLKDSEVNIVQRIIFAYFRRQYQLRKATSHV